MPSLPVPSESQRISEVKHLLLFTRPAAVGEFVRRNSGATQQLLHLVARKFRLAIEDTQELPSKRFCSHWRRLSRFVRILVDQLVDADQGILHRDRTTFVHKDLAVVA